MSIRSRWKTSSHLHPKILDVAVFGLPDPVMGSIVACAVVPKAGKQEDYHGRNTGVLQGSIGLL